MQPTAQLQKTAGKAASKNLKFSFLEKTGFNNDWLKNLFLYFLPPLHNANDFPSDSLTLGIFNNNTFFGTIKKIDKK